MCLEISDRDVRRDSTIQERSLTRTWVVKLTEYRNASRGSEGCGFATIGRRGVGAIGYPLLFVAALVEAVVRLVLGVVMALWGTLTAVVCCDCHIPYRNISEMFLSIPDQFDTALRCVVGFVKNLWRDQMPFTALAISEGHEASELDQREVTALFASVPGSQASARSQFSPGSF